MIDVMFIKYKTGLTWKHHACQTGVSAGCPVVVRSCLYRTLHATPDLETGFGLIFTAPPGI